MEKPSSGIYQRLPPLERIEWWVLRLPLRTPFTTSFGTQSFREALVLRIRGQGLSGWGECVALTQPSYSYETTGGAVTVIQDYLIPVLKKTPARSLAEILQAFTGVRGYPMAKAALENALLDLIARMEGIPLYGLLGGTEKPIPSGISIGIQPSESRLVEEVQKAVEKGYRRYKLKITPGKDLIALEAVRNRFPDIPLLVDANGAYRWSDLENLQALDRFQLKMIEQPLQHDDLYFHSQLHLQIQTPICLDESIHSPGDVHTAASMKSCDIINIKQGRVGGLLAAREIHDLAGDYGMAVWSGGMLETGIGRAFNLHLQTLTGFTEPGDTSETGRYYETDFTRPAIRLRPDGMIDLPAGPGTGVQVIEEEMNPFVKEKGCWILNRA